MEHNEEIMGRKDAESTVKSDEDEEEEGLPAGFT